MVELTDQQFVLSVKGSGTRDVIQKRLKDAGIELLKTIEFGNTETVKRAVAAGIGISILSEATIRNELAAGQICAVPLDDGGIARTFYMALHRDKYRTRATGALVEMLNDSLF